MKWWIILGVVIGLGLALVVFLVENATERFVGWLFRAIGLDSGKGPLVARAATDGGERVLVTLENRGANRIKLAAVEGQDGSRKRVFPTPVFQEGDTPSASAEGAAHREFSKVVLEPGESKTVFFDFAELVASGCETLAVIDSQGRSWRVEGYQLKPL